MFVKVPNLEHCIPLTLPTLHRNPIVSYHANAQDCIYRANDGERGCDSFDTSVETPIILGNLL